MWQHTPKGCGGGVVVGVAAVRPVSCRARGRALCGHLACAGDALTYIRWQLGEIQEREVGGGGDVHGQGSLGD